MDIEYESIARDCGHSTYASLHICVTYSIGLLFVQRRNTLIMKSDK